MNDVGLIHIEEAAKLLKMSPMRIRQLAGEGWMPKPVKGQLPLVAAVHGYIDFMRDDARRNSKSAAASRVTDARAREIELKIAERDGRLVELDEALGLLAEIIGLIRSEATGLGARVTRDPEMRRRIDAGVHGVFERTHDRLNKEAALLRSGRKPDEAEPEGDA